MSEEKLMRKYKYGYKHSKDLLNEPYVKDLQQRIYKAVEYINSQIITYEDDDKYGEDCCCDGFELLEILKGDSND